MLWSCITLAVSKKKHASPFHYTFLWNTEVHSVPVKMGPLEWSHSGLRLLTTRPSKWAHLANTAGPLQRVESLSQGITLFGLNFPSKVVPVCSSGHQTAREADQDSPVLLKWPSTVWMAASRLCHLGLPGCATWGWSIKMLPSTPSQRTPFWAALGAVLSWLYDQAHCAQYLTFPSKFTCISCTGFYLRNEIPKQH